MIPPQRDARLQAAEAYLKRDDNQILFAVAGPVERIAKRAAAINSAMRQVRLSPSLSAAEKREQLDQLQLEKNRLFDAIAVDLSRKRLREYEEQVR